MEYRQALGFVGIVKVNYTGQKKFLPIFFKFKLNKRGVSFLGECKYQKARSTPISNNRTIWGIFMTILMHDKTDYLTYLVGK